MGLFSRKNPFSDLKFDRKPFEDRKNETLNASNTIYDASIGEAANRSAMAGSVSGVANQGRLSADTFARITGDRNAKNASIIAGYNQQAAQAETAFNRDKQNKEADWEASQPTFLDYLTGASNLALGGLSIYSAIKGIGTTPFAPTGGRGLSGMNSKIAPASPPPGTTFVPASTEAVNSNSIVNQFANGNINIPKNKTFNLLNPFGVQKKEPKLWR